jgi:prepilin-type N-terminal cleavage/methylation domain-containing protein
VSCRSEQRAYRMVGVVAMLRVRRDINGFTIVELLIVIVVIGILAAITIVSFNGVQDKARGAKVNSDIAQIKKAIAAAEATSGKTLNGITSSYSTGAPCWSKAAGTNLSSLDKTNDQCWIDYKNTLSAISNASGVNITALVDPWNRPYLIDENEGEGGGCSTKDTIAVFPLPVTGAFGINGTYSKANDVPFSGNSICS